MQITPHEPRQKLRDAWGVKKGHGGESENEMTSNGSAQLDLACHVLQAHSPISPRNAVCMCG